MTARPIQQLAIRLFLQVRIARGLAVVRLSGERVYAYVSTDFAVSSGTQVRVCVSGEYESAVQ